MQYHTVPSVIVFIKRFEQDRTGQYASGTLQTMSTARNITNESTSVKCPENILQKHFPLRESQDVSSTRDFPFVLLFI